MASSIKPHILFKTEGTFSMKTPAGHLCDLPLIWVFVNGKKTNVSLDRVLGIPDDTFPLTDNVFLEHDSKTHSLGVYGAQFVWCLQQGIGWQAANFCHSFSTKFLLLTQTREAGMVSI